MKTGILCYLTHKHLGVRKMDINRAGGGTGRRDGLKSRWAYAREGSSPSLPKNTAEFFLLFLF